MTRKYASFDTSEVRAVAADFGDAPARISHNVTSVMFKSASNIKRTMREDAQASKHFKGIARDIDFDINDHEFGGVGVLSAEIGPRSESGAAGNLANIAYFGNSKGAGGTVRDPEAALEEELPAFERFMEAAAIRALG